MNRLENTPKFNKQKTNTRTTTDIGEPSSISIEGQSNDTKLKSKKLVRNPLFGYRIKEFFAAFPDTEVFRVSHSTFMTFMERSVVNRWTEKEQLSNLPQEIRLEQLTKKQRDNFFRIFKFRKFDKNDVMLKANEVPDNLLIVVQGNLTLYSHTLEPKENNAPVNPALIMKVYPGSRVKT